MVENRFHFTRAAPDVRRPDCLVRFLRVLGLGLVLARGRRHIVFAVIGSDQPPSGGERLFCNIHAIGAHVSDEADGLAIDVDALV